MALLGDVGLIDVVGPDGVEGSDVAGHAGHEAGEEGGQAQAEHAGREVVEQHDGDGQVVVVEGVPSALRTGWPLTGSILTGMMPWGWASSRGSAVAVGSRRWRLRSASGCHRLPG